MRSSKTTRFAWALVLAAGAAGGNPFGCGGTVSAEGAASASSAATRAPVAQGTHGLVKLAGEALGDVSLTAAQRAQMEQLARSVDAAHDAVRSARKDLALSLAPQVEAGKVDRAALGPKIDALAAAVRASQPADRAAFERLHAILDPGQRGAFVDSLEARAAERMQEVGAKHPWRRWADELELTPDQRSACRAALQAQLARPSFPAPGALPIPGADAGGRGAGALGPVGGRRAKRLEAFRQDRFVMDEVAPAGDVGRQAEETAEQFLGVAEAVLPILTSEQRAIAARKLRAEAASDDQSLLP